MFQAHILPDFVPSYYTLSKISIENMIYHKSRTNNSEAELVSVVMLATVTSNGLGRYMKIKVHEDIIIIHKLIWQGIIDSILSFLKLFNLFILYSVAIWRPWRFLLLLLLFMRFNCLVLRLFPLFMPLDNNRQQDHNH